MKRAFKLGAFGLLLILIAGLVAPFIRVDQYREQIRDGLQRSLHRKVEILGDTRLNLFRGPGFSVEKVVIHDDPSAGLEAFANVPELQASVRLSSLWGGRLEFDTVRFVEPSLNIVKPDAGTWNLAPLLAGAAAQTSAGRLPEIRVSSGRINFKFGKVKSPFYLTETDLTVSPSGDGLDIRFAAAPARTDRSAQGYGLFSGRGRWAGGRLELDVELEKSSLEELVTLARGQSLGLHGQIASRARLSGPLSRIDIRGSFELEDVHRWDLFEAGTNSLRMAYRGSLDFSAQRLEILADDAANRGTPVALKLILGDILYNPKWSIEAALNGVPAGQLMEAAKHTGAPVPAGITVDGKAEGVVAYSPLAGVQGQITVADARVKVEAGPEFRIPQATVLLSGDEIRLLPATLSGKREAAQLEVTYAPFRQHIAAQLAGRGLAIADLQQGRGHLLHGAAVPVFDRFNGGTWSGSLSFTSSENRPGEWTCDVRIQDTSISFPGLAVPVEIVTADVALKGTDLRLRGMRGSAAGIDFFGEYRYEDGAPRPHRFALAIPEASLADMEKVFLPSLRRNASFLSRTFRFRSSAVPDWLRSRMAEGTVRIGLLTAGDHQFRAVRARLVWNGAQVQMPLIRARLDEAPVEATAAVDLTRTEPIYSLQGAVTGYAWRGGALDFRGTLKSAGTGAEALLNLAGSGTFEMRGVQFHPDLFVRTATGTMDFSVARTGPQLKLTVTQAAVGAERFTGEGATGADGRFHMDLASATRTMSLEGPILPLKLEVTSDRIAR